mmetsp:Transcript_33718/g.55679  ORF Transcript_33718/g.55679 Transcript_33718/m.55679 type:complete len:328 (+) Transcript_33718:92-1075(+)
MFDDGREVISQTNFTTVSDLPPKMPQLEKPSVNTPMTDPPKYQSVMRPEYDPRVISTFHTGRHQHSGSIKRRAALDFLGKELRQLEVEAVLKKQLEQQVESLMEELRRSQGTAAMYLRRIEMLEAELLRERSRSGSTFNPVSKHISTSATQQLCISAPHNPVSQQLDTEGIRVPRAGAPVSLAEAATKLPVGLPLPISARPPFPTNQLPPPPHVPKPTALMLWGGSTTSSTSSSTRPPPQNDRDLMMSPPIHDSIDERPALRLDEPLIGHANSELGRVVNSSIGAEANDEFERLMAEQLALPLPPAAAKDSTPRAPLKLPKGVRLVA